MLGPRAEALILAITVLTALFTGCTAVEEVGEAVQDSVDGSTPGPGPEASPNGTVDSPADEGNASNEREQAATTAEDPVGILDSHSRTDGDLYHVEGVVENRADEVRKISVEARFLAANGSVVETASKSPAVGPLAPGETSPFSFLVLDEEDEIVDDELNVSSESTSREPPDTESLRIQGTTLADGTDQGAVLQGEVQNTDTQQANAVEVHAAFFDPEGRLLQVENGEVATASIEAGQRAPFQLSVDAARSQISESEVSLDLASWSQGPPGDGETKVDAVPRETNAYETEDGRYRVVGIVENDGEANGLIVETIVTFYGSQGEVLDVVVTNPLRPNLPPNETSPFQATGQADGQPIVDHSLAFHAVPGRASGTGANLTVTDTQASRDGSGNYVLQGNVTNEGPDAAGSVGVAVAFEAADGSLVQATAKSVSPQRLEASQQGTFEVTPTDPPREIVSHQVWVDSASGQPGHEW